MYLSQALRKAVFGIVGNTTGEYGNRNIPQSPAECTGEEETWKARVIFEYVQHEVWHILHQLRHGEKKKCEYYYFSLNHTPHNQPLKVNVFSW